MLVIRVYLLDRRALFPVAPPLWVIEEGEEAQNQQGVLLTLPAASLPRLNSEPTSI